MPSFDIVSEVDRMEVKNAIDHASKELSTRFDFKGVKATIELDPKTGSIQLTTDNGDLMKALRQIVMEKLAKRSVDLRNVDMKDPDISPLGHSRQELAIKQGLDGDRAKEIIQAVKAQKWKIQATLQDRKIRVSGTKRDDLQKVISFLRGGDYGVVLNYENFRE